VPAATSNGPEQSDGITNTGRPGHAQDWASPAVRGPYSICVIFLYPGDYLFRRYPDVKDRERPIPDFHRALPQISKQLSHPRRSEGNYTSLRSIQASGRTKSTLAKLRIHSDPNCAELCAGPALATSRLSPSPTEGANRRNRHRVGMR
jgi:hypothetical protein